MKFTHSPFLDGNNSCEEICFISIFFVFFCFHLFDYDFIFIHLFTQMAASSVGLQ